MNTIILSCPTLKGELLAALKQAQNTTPVYFLPKELHSSPDNLRKYVQDFIDRLHNVDRVVLCVSGCGGGTTGLKATTAEIIVPRTRDCVDILLSNREGEDKRKRRVYMTKSWYDYHQDSALNLDKLVETKGKEEAENFIRTLYKGFEEFYIVDTGTYDIQEIMDGLKPFIEVLNGSFKIVKGGYSILHKIAQQDFDDCFEKVAIGACVPPNFYPENPKEQSLLPADAYLEGESIKMLRISLSLLSVLIFFVAGCSIGESYFGPKSVSTYTNITNKNLTSRVIHVSDGDTIVMLAPDGGKVKVRLYGIDAPEKAQPYGPQAAGILKNLILNQVVTIDTINVDRYGRYVAKVFYNRQDINAEMIRLGAAWHYRYYDKSPSYMQYEELERYARVNRRGLWNRDNPTPPWEYRKRIREQQGRK